MSLKSSWLFALCLLAPAVPAQIRDARSFPFGFGCPGSVGVPVFERAPGSLPHLGHTFELRLSNLPTPPLFGSQALILLGFSRRDWLGMSLPLPLEPYGMPDCRGYVSVDASVFVASSASAIDWSLDIPDETDLVGLEFFLQALVHDPGVNTLGAVATNAVAGVVGLGPFDIVEDFKDETRMDRDVSAGTWSDSLDPDGEGTFGAIGRDGSHGEFSLGIANQLNFQVIGGEVFAVYEMDTDHTSIPGINTISGDTVVVTDGVYYFSKFVLPPRTLLRFKGSHPAQIHVRGTIDIDGILDLSGRDVPAVVSTLQTIFVVSQNEFGQPGGSGSAGGGDGGSGGDKPDGLGLQARFNGQDGGPADVLAGHAYAQAAQDTGGKGSPMFPLDGLESSLLFTLPEAFPIPFQVGSVANGGGGGGHVRVGENGQILFHANSDPAPQGPEGAGGGVFPALLPVPPGSRSSEHFLIPGGGGGGAGGHAMQSFRSPMLWNSGAGGAGGAGAISLRAGHRLRTGAGSRILAVGGSGGFYDLTRHPGLAPPAPGGGGSGGSVVMQCPNPDEVTLSGLVDVRGGAGTSVEHVNVAMKGGDGSHGLFRLETPLPLPDPGSVEPAFGAATVGELTEVDPNSAFQSTWYDTGLQSPPTFLRYRVDVEIDGVPTTYSDDRAQFRDSRLAGPGEPVVFRVQGAVLDPSTGEPEPSSVRPWRLYVGDQGAPTGQPGLVDDEVTAVRFLIVLDRSVLGPGSDVTIRQVTITHDL